ncbi:MAG: hypothetical protein ABW321_29865 [Polyangiales bacterium]
MNHDASKYAQLSAQDCPNPVSLGAGIGLISLALMHAQIVLTRIFSVIVWYHFAFFAISVALLGLGASALVVYLLRDTLLAERAPRHLALGSLAFAGSLLGVAMVLLQLTPEWFGMGVGNAFTVLTPKLLVVFFVTTLPFFLGGFVVSLALMRWPTAMHRNYAWDLGGAALACVVVIPVLDRLGAPNALLVSVALGGVSAVLFGLGERVKAALAYALVGVLITALGVFASAQGGLAIRAAKGLDLTRAAPEYGRWNSFSLVNVFPSWGFQGWGLSPKYKGPIPEQKSLIIDMNALTTLTAFRPGGELTQAEYTRHDLSALVFRARETTERTCIIGAGGGKDVLAALIAGSRHVAAVEVNPLIADDVMSKRYREFTGGLYQRPEVAVHIEDGRSYVRRTDERYDVILISMVDTSAATAAGAYALAENSIYTVSAFRDFFSRLTPDGMLTVASVSLEGLAVGARLAAVARAALAEHTRDVARAVAVIETPWVAVPHATMYNLVIKPSGFSDKDLARLNATLLETGFGATYLPDQPNPAPDDERRWIARILTAKDDSALARDMARWELDVSPVDDDRPYFFYQNRLRDAWEALASDSPTHLFGNGLAVLIKVLVAAVVMVSLCILLPMLIGVRGHSTLRGARFDVSYVCALGLGYMFIELGTIQKLMPYLGSPTSALTSVLLTLLLAGAFGSAAMAKHPGKVRLALLGLVVYASVLFAGWHLVAHATAGVSVNARAVIAGVALAPLGFLMGMPLPSGLAAVRVRNAERVPWLWGVNGATSVLGSVLSTLGSMHFGITALLTAGVGAYVIAALLWPRIQRAAS